MPPQRFHQASFENPRPGQIYRAHTLDQIAAPQSLHQLLQKRHLPIKSDHHTELQTQQAQAHHDDDHSEVVEH